MNSNPRWARSPLPGREWVRVSGFPDAGASGNMRGPRCGERCEAAEVAAPASAKPEASGTVLDARGVLCHLP